MLRRDYPLLLGRQSPVFARTSELGRFLYRRWRGGAFQPALARPVEGMAYHRPCHLADLEEEPGFLELFREALGVELSVLPDRCCGMAGTYGMRRRTSDLGRRIGTELFERLIAGRFNGFVTECSSCRMQLEGESGVAGAHPVELLAVT